MPAKGEIPPAKFRQLSQDGGPPDKRERMRASAFRYLSSRWSNLSIRYKGAVVIAIPCACMLLALLFFTLLNRDQQAAVSETLRTQQAQLEVSRLLTALVDAETGMRGYLLTGQEEFLESYQRGLTVVPDSGRALRRLVRDPSRLKQLDEIESLARERLELMRLALEASRTSKLTATPELAAHLTRGKQRMDRLRGEIAQFEAEEDRLEQLRRERMQAEQTWFQWGLGLASVMALGGGILAVFLFSSGISQRLKALELGAGEMAQGMAVSWPLSGGDEISRLARRLQSAAQAIAERQQAEDDLKRFFSVSMDLVCIAGTDGYFKVVNPRWEKILGYSQQELLSQPYLEFIHPEDREATVQEVAKQAEGHPVISFENRYRCRDGSYRWLNWTATAVTERGLIYAAARDVTERKQDEQRIQELNRELGHKLDELAAVNKELEGFSYSVAHDLRAPLRHVDGFSKILLEDHGAEMKEEARRLLERVRDGAQHMGALIDELLNFSRLGRQEPRRQITGLNSLVEEARSSLRAEGDGRAIEWRVGRLPYADCDPALMKQVFSNLLANALKFTRPREQAVIEVGQLADNGQTAIFVRDNGVGFDMKYAGKLFGVFQRLHRPEDFEGTGVGLALVQKIIQKHGGRIWVEAALDRGATFYFTLGAAEAAPQPTGTQTEVRDGR